MTTTGKTIVRLDPLFDAELQYQHEADARRTWQRFSIGTCTRDRAPGSTWTDFPPAAIRPLLDMPPSSIVGRPRPADSSCPRCDCVPRSEGVPWNPTSI